MTTVDDIMTHAVVTVQMDSTLKDIQVLFERHAFHHLIVLEQGQLVGILSDRDYLSAISPFAGTPSERNRDVQTLKRPVHQIMTRRPTTIHMDASVEDATRCMLDAGCSALPVLDGQHRVRGIVTMRDLLRHFAPPPEPEPDDEARDTDDAPTPAA